jgi:hypothetical protein
MTSPYLTRFNDFLCMHHLSQHLPHKIVSLSLFFCALFFPTIFLAIVPCLVLFKRLNNLRFGGYSFFYTMLCVGVQCYYPWLLRVLRGLCLQAFFSISKLYSSSLCWRTTAMEVCIFRFSLLFLLLAKSA